MNEIDHTLRDTLHEPAPVKVEPPSIAPDEEPSSRILLWAVCIVLVLVVGVLALRVFYKSGGTAADATVTYNGFDFEHREGLWWGLWQQGDAQYVLSLHFNPQQTLNITPVGKISKTFERPDVYVAFDPTVEDQSYVALGAAELSLNLAHALGVNVTPACTVNATDDCIGRPIVTCATPNASIILLQETNSSAGIVLSNDCMTLYGSRLELLRSIDRVLYTFYGIIPSLDTRP
jgi:hypothetical protein